MTEECQWTLSLEFGTQADLRVQMDREQINQLMWQLSQAQPKGLLKHRSRFIPLHHITGVTLYGSEAFGHTLGAPYLEAQ